MSGHSKWSKIKRQKGIDDQKRGEAFSKLGREITVAAQKSKGGDPYKDPVLRQLMDKAKAINMPRANIDRAIAKASAAGGDNREQLLLEGYGPAGVAFIVKVGTDNRQRSVAEIKNLFERSGGSIAAPGAAMFMFTPDGGGGFAAKAKLFLADSEGRKVRELTEALTARGDVDGVFHSA